MFAGTTRISTKLEKPDGGNGGGNTAPLEDAHYFYHPDHLGSSSYITNDLGQVFQHLEYFPFGETFVEEHSNTQRAPYLFTGKELDEDTGLYYYGARYYDPRTSLWQSADPILAKYLPGRGQDVGMLLPNVLNGYGSPRHAMPGMGGVFTGQNLSLYHYSHQNPLRYLDPDGRAAGTLTAGGAFCIAGACEAAAAATVAAGAACLASGVCIAGLVVVGVAGLGYGGYLIYDNLTSGGDQVAPNTVHNEASEAGDDDEVELGGFLEGDDVKDIGDHADEVGEVTGVIDRKGAKDRRKENLKGVKTKPGVDRDEFPPAVVKPNDPSKTSVKHKNRSQNRRSGQKLRWEIDKIPDGTRVRIKPPGNNN